MGVDMIIRNTFKTALLASVCMLPMTAAMAGQDNAGINFAEATPAAEQPTGPFDNEATIGPRNLFSVNLHKAICFLACDYASRLI